MNVDPAQLIALSWAVGFASGVFVSVVAGLLYRLTKDDRQIR